MTLETLTNLDLENLGRLPTTEKNRRAILTETRATPTLHLFLLDAHKLNQYDFLLLKQILNLILSIKASTFTLRVQCLMESLRDNFNKLVQKTLTMEDPRIKNDQQRPIIWQRYRVNWCTTATTWWTTQKNSKWQKKAKISLSKRVKVRLSIDTESSILPLELNILQLELNLEIFCLISHTLALVKMTFIMKISSWTSTCCSLKIWIFFSEQKSFRENEERDHLHALERAYSSRIL